MKITDKWLKNKGACYAAIKRLSEEKNRDEICLINKGLKSGKFDWINWYIARRLNKTRIKSLEEQNRQLVELVKHVYGKSFYWAPHMMQEVWEKSETKQQLDKITGEANGNM